jgi:hypothetical protein
MIRQTAHSQSATFFIDNAEYKLMLLSVFNLLGKEIFKTEFSSSSVNIPRIGFSKGIYFFRVTKKEAIVAACKLIVE